MVKLFAKRLKIIFEYRVPYRLSGRNTLSLLFAVKAHLLNLLEVKNFFHPETCNGQNSDLKGSLFLTMLEIRHLWQLEIVILVHKCLLCTLTFL